MHRIELGKGLRFAIFGGALTLLLGVMAACAGDDDETTTQTQDQPAAAEQPAAAAAAADPSAPAAATGTTATTTSVGMTLPQAPSPQAAEQFSVFPQDGMPQYGGIYRAARADQTTLNFFDNITSNGKVLTTNSYDTLMGWDWTSGYASYKTPGPGLAESWEFNADGTVWTFYLRKNAVFHDGTPLTSADVKASLDFYRDPGEAGPPGASSVRPYVESIEAPDPYTIVLNLKGPNPVILYHMATGWVAIASKKDLDKGIDWFKTNVNGTGPFKFNFDKWERGIRWVVDRNQAYWAEGLPYLDGKHYFEMGSTAANLAAFETKRIDDTQSATADQVKDMLSRYGDQMNVIQKPGAGHSYVLQNVRRPPFDDPKVRRAVYLWLDRPEFIAKVASGSAYLGDWIDPVAYNYGTPFEELQKNNLAFREDKTEARKLAKELLAEAGYSDLSGVKITVLSRYTSGGSLRGNQILASQMEEMGFDVTLTIMERLAGTQALRSGDYNLAYYGGASPFYGAPDGTLNRYVAPTGQRNYTGISEPEFERILADINTTVEPQKRAALIAEMDAYLQRGEWSMTIVQWNLQNILRWNYLHGKKYHSTLEEEDERVWLSSDAPGRK